MVGRVIRPLALLRAVLLGMTADLVGAQRNSGQRPEFNEDSDAGRSGRETFARPFHGWMGFFFRGGRKNGDQNLTSSRNQERSGSPTRFARRDPETNQATARGKVSERRYLGCLLLWLYGGEGAFWGREGETPDVGVQMAPFSAYPILIYGGNDRLTGRLAVCLVNNHGRNPAEDAPGLLHQEARGGARGPREQVRPASAAPFPLGYPQLTLTPDRDAVARRRC